MCIDQFTQSTNSTCRGPFFQKFTQREITVVPTALLCHIPVEVAPIALRLGTAVIANGNSIPRDLGKPPDLLVPTPISPDLSHTKP